MKRGKLLLSGLCACLLLLGGATPAYATTPPRDFNLQVSPSPLVMTVTPGAKAQAELTIRNNGTGVEDLKVEPRSFTYSDGSNTVKLEDTITPAVASWISFSAAKFTLHPGQFFNEVVSLNVPQNAGFSYSFALIISRQAEPEPTGSGRLIKGSLAVFTLVNVDRPGAKSSLEVVSFKASKRVYEYVPATFSVQFRNNGNTITQPYGNIFVQRGANDKVPLATLAVNQTRGYILPGTTRTITASWDNGFPAYHAVQTADGSTSQKLVWDWTKVSQLHIGRYTAHLVGVYSQAGRDMPIEGTVSFWVIPWKILLGLLLLVLLLLFSLSMFIRLIVKVFLKQRAKKRTKKPVPPTS